MKLRAAFILGTLLALPLPHLALGQGTPVYQDGTVIPGHLPKFLTNGRIGDAGVSVGDAQVPGIVAPIVPTNADLITTSTAAAPNGVWRLDFAAGNGAPPLFYRPSTATCSLNAGNGDGGSQVRGADGKCWLAAFGATYDVRQWGAKPDVDVTDSSAAINAAILYAQGVGGAVDLGGQDYGVCANPVLVGGNTVKRITVGNGRVNLQGGCGTPPEEILFNNAGSANGYSAGLGFHDLTVDGGCRTKYVYKVVGGGQTTHRGVFIQNPAHEGLIANSAAVYINGGFELKLDRGNFVLAAGPCYNSSGRIPTYGIWHDVGGNADFSGVLVVNFVVGIRAGGDDFFGPGTHIWGGCQLVGGGCTFNAALRVSQGVLLTGAGQAYGIEVDDPKLAGVSLVSYGDPTTDRLVAIGTTCVYSSTPDVTQSCVIVNAGVGGSLVSGTTAPQLAAAGFPQNILNVKPAGHPSTTITDNPWASVYGGEAAVTNMVATLPASPDGCIGLTGYQAGASSCLGTSPISSPFNGCQVKLVQLALSNAPGAGNSTKFTIQDNGADTGLTGTASGASNFGFNNSYPWSIPPSHNWSIRVQTTAGTPAATQVRVSIYGCG